MSYASLVETQLASTTYLKDSMANLPPSVLSKRFPGTHVTVPLRTGSNCKSLSSASLFYVNYRTSTVSQKQATVSLRTHQYCNAESSTATYSRPSVYDTKLALLSKNVFQRSGAATDVCVQEKNE